MGWENIQGRLTHAWLLLKQRLDGRDSLFSFGFRPASPSERADFWCGILLAVLLFSSYSRIYQG